MSRDDEIRRTAQANGDLSAELRAAAMENIRLAKHVRPEVLHGDAVHRAIRLREIPEQMHRIRQMEGRDNKPDLQRLDREFHHHQNHR